MGSHLLKAAIEALKGRVSRIAITDLKENTYFALITIESGSETIELDARPSDAIALAMRCDVPLYCDSDIIERAHIPEEAREEDGDDTAVLADQGEGEEQELDEGPKPLLNIDGDPPEEFLENLSPEDFGKYKM